VRDTPATFIFLRLNISITQLRTDDTGSKTTEHVTQPIATITVAWLAQFLQRDFVFPPLV
jgi:hypothetical protein